MSSSTTLPSISSPRLASIVSSDAPESIRAGSTSEAYPSSASLHSNTNNSNMAMIPNSAASASSTTVTSSATLSRSFSAATYGDMFGATIHFWLESVVARCRSDRVALFLPHPKHHTLVRVAMVGPTAQSVQTQNAAVAAKPGDPGVAGPVAAAVLQTGVAANLCQVAQEDCLDCPGTSLVKTALVVPIKPFRASASTAAIGVIFVVNKNGGADAFTSDDQHVVVSVAPSLAYLVETYPIDFSMHRFDPVPLHKIVTQVRSSVHHHQDQRHRKSSSYKTGTATTGAQQQQQAIELALPEKPPLLVYEQGGHEAMLPYVAQSLATTSASLASSPNATMLMDGAGGGTSHQPQKDAAAMSALSTAQQILSVGEFVDSMEQCWRDAVSRCIATERELTLRNAQVVDAHAILHRKQRRLEVLKDVLVETLDRRQTF